MNFDESYIPPESEAVPMAVDKNASSEGQSSYAFGRKWTEEEGSEEELSGLFQELSSIENHESKDFQEKALIFFSKLPSSFSQEAIKPITTLFEKLFTLEFFKTADMNVLEMTAQIVEKVEKNGIQVDEKKALLEKRLYLHSLDQAIQESPFDGDLTDIYNRLNDLAKEDLFLPLSQEAIMKIILRGEFSCLDINLLWAFAENLSQDQESSDELTNFFQIFFDGIMSADDLFFQDLAIQFLERIPTKVATDTVRGGCSFINQLLDKLLTDDFIENASPSLWTRMYLVYEKLPEEKQKIIDRRPLVLSIDEKHSITISPEEIEKEMDSSTKLKVFNPSVLHRIWTAAHKMLEHAEAMSGDLADDYSLKDEKAILYLKEEKSEEVHEIELLFEKQLLAPGSFKSPKVLVPTRKGGECLVFATPVEQGPRDETEKADSRTEKISRGSTEEDFAFTGEEAGEPVDKATENIEREVSFSEKFSDVDGIVKEHLVRVLHGGVGILMPYYRGGNLSQFIQKLPPMEKDDYEYALSFLALQIATALQAMHERGVVHLDMKAGNIFIDAKDEEVQAIVGDLGLCEELTEGCFISMKDKMTPVYAPPEFFSNPTEAIPHSSMDVWSFGMLLYQMRNLKNDFHDPLLFLDYAFRSLLFQDYFSLSDYHETLRKFINAGYFSKTQCELLRFSFATTREDALIRVREVYNEKVDELLGGLDPNQEFDQILSGLLQKDPGARMTLEEAIYRLQTFLQRPQSLA